MDPTFAGRPVFVMHVDGVEEDVDELRKDADGWVIESFFNQADGKHWVKFLVVSERGERAIGRGMQLSNCYVPEKFAQGGLWNGVSYAKEIKSGEYEHLAIVPNPRYEESVILTPEKFKKYNEDKILELKRLSNAKGAGPMLKLFKRTKVENAVDLSDMSVMLPKSKKEMTLTEVVTSFDDHLEAQAKLKNSPMAAHPEHLVDMGEGSKMTVNDLVAKHKAMCDELDAMKKKNVDAPDEEGDPSHGDVDMTGKDKMNDGDDDFTGAQDSTQVAGTNAEKKNEDDGDEDDKKKKKKTENEEDVKKKNDLEAKKKKDKEKADRLRNADKREPDEEARVEFSEDQVARGKSRYGS